MLSYCMLYYVLSNYIISCYIRLYQIILYNIILYHIVLLHFIVMLCSIIYYHIISYHVILYYIMSHYIILHYTIFNDIQRPNGSITEGHGQYRAFNLKLIKMIGLLPFPNHRCSSKKSVPVAGLICGQDVLQLATSRAWYGNDIHQSSTSGFDGSTGSCMWSFWYLRSNLGSGKTASSILRWSRLLFRS